MNIIKKLRIDLEQRADEVQKLGFTFSPEIDIRSLSLGELNDLASLGVGETTYVLTGDSSGTDVTRIK